MEKRDIITKILFSVIVLVWRVVRVWRKYVNRNKSTRDDSKHQGEIPESINKRKDDKE